ncbi:MAG: low molecular weight phosphotyrosine protein phosphatase [Bacteroidales bacterium]|nr:low molecular weight phosphotyrosine protein phosphatase [Bacteroidales bacterium]
MKIDGRRVDSILFVCLGNICRSPAADAVMRKKAAERGLTISVDSAGIGPWHVGQLPDSRMRRCGAKHGYNINHIARQVKASDFELYDVIVGMDGENMAALTRMAKQNGADAGRIVCLADYLTESREYTTVPDPYYGDEEDFEIALRLIEEAVDNLLAQE